MPNWSQNEIAVIGKRKKTIDFLNAGIKKDQLSYEVDQNSLSNFLQIQKYTMRSWYPMPKTFTDWDTTNSKCNLRDFIFRYKQKEAAKLYNIPRTPEGRKQFYSIVQNLSDEALRDFEEDYKKYSDGYDKAVEYQKKTYDCVGWYDYNCKTLGTKWDATTDIFLSSITEDKITLRIECQTAWSFPGGWLNSLVKDFPDLDFICYAVEESYEYCGYFDAKKSNWEDCQSGGEVDEGYMHQKYMQYCLERGY